VPLSYLQCHMHRQLAVHNHSRLMVLRALLLIVCPIILLLPIKTIKCIHHSVEITLANTAPTTLATIHNSLETTQDLLHHSTMATSDSRLCLLPRCVGRSSCTFSDLHFAFGRGRWLFFYFSTVGNLVLRYSGVRGVEF